ncbi:MAG: hypothetical protein HFH08_00990 [Bacilli bacterium]|nr:hypothetical protein [Bacilli bacterium]
MESEASLIEQIETDIDQLDLLGMQENVEKERIEEVIARIKGLARQYVELLDSIMEQQIQETESLFALTLEEELDKRKMILTHVTNKKNCIIELFKDIKEIEVAAPLQQFVDAIIIQATNQVTDYERDVKLVETQFEKIKEAETKEAELKSKKSQAHIRMTNLRNSQMSFADLNAEFMTICSHFLDANHAEEIDFPNLMAKRDALTKRRKRLMENLKLAHSAKDAEGYVVAYEGYIKTNQLELDKVDEKKVLHLIRKIVMGSPIDSYETLTSRTLNVQKLINSRVAKVGKLYEAGVVTREDYETFASQVDFSKIYERLSEVAEIERCEKQIRQAENGLQHTRDHIKGKDELETIFIERAKARGRIPAIPEKPEILFEDENVISGKKKKRRKIISVEPAKAHIVEKIDKMKQWLISSLNSMTNISKKIGNQIRKMITVPEKYKPSIGDKIKLGEKAAIFTNPMDVIEQKDQKDAKSIGLTELDLYVTRGAILDYTGTPIYMTTDYGIDLETIAKNMNLEIGTYNIALGCSIGDSEGKFMAVANDQLNPNIEKGWINATDINIMVINQLNKELKKGGMSK